MFRDYENKAVKNITQKIQINRPLAGYKPGSIVEIEMLDKKTPAKRYWRDRLHDSKVDNCIEFLKDKDIKRSKK